MRLIGLWSVSRCDTAAKRTPPPSITTRHYSFNASRPDSWTAYGGSSLDSSTTMNSMKFYSLSAVCDADAAESEISHSARSPISFCFEYFKIRDQHFSIPLAHFGLRCVRHLHAFHVPN